MGFSFKKIGVQKGKTPLFIRVFWVEKQAFLLG